jgi:type I restriction-modification system DNA methylase subunit
MSKYDGLDARTQLEQTIALDLRNALEKRGFTVRHNGTSTRSAPSKVPDIETWTEDVHINIEATKTTKSSADREMLSISDHLNKTKAFHSQKQCFAIYVSPSTHYRMINAIHDYNLVRRTNDQKIIPVCFSTFDLLIEKLSSTHKSLYDQNQIVKIFSRHNEFTDDDNILRIIYQELFPADIVLKKQIEDREIVKHAQIEQDLFAELETIENRLRESGIATATNAIRNLIYLVFLKLYEEKQEMGGGKNYFTVQNFLEFQQAQGQSKKKQAIHKLFEIIRDEEEFQKSSLFTKTDQLAEKLDDDFALEQIIKPLEKYRFYVTKVDGLGAAYEVLALRSSKDVKVGQFFTPKHVVQFMVKLADLEPSDLILDPACGTGRFLIWAMDDMLSKVSGKNADQTIKSIKFNQLFGTDNDSNVAKLAKMNMYIHGDGKANIWDDDGLLLYKTKNLDGRIDVILTNPPLGRMNYRKAEYDEEFLKRMIVIPRATSEVSSKNTEQDEDRITGNLMKGGALFVNASAHYLKDVRDSKAPLEWRGGKLLIILDEGILNTDDYKKTRQFIRKRFYIKAIISLTTDTFVPVSKTPTKTSIIYAIKKDDPTALQKEPVFYAHASKVGMDTKKRPCPNHLMNEEGKDILSEYLSFRNNILTCYDGLTFDQQRFETLGLRSGIIAEA